MSVSIWVYTAGTPAEQSNSTRLTPIASAIIPNPDADFTLDDSPYSASNLIVTSLPGAVLRLLQTDSSTRLLANPQLRISEGETAEARFGDQVPVPVTIFASIATGGFAQQPITSFEYKNVGVNIARGRPANSSTTDAQNSTFVTIR